VIRLSFEQGRILGAMLEKAMTTPANYPMSLNAVAVACNQVSNREPVAEFTDDEVEMVLRGLADDGLAKMVHRPGDRVVKYRQALDDQLQTSAQETALMAVLLLRGAQTPGELRQRTNRYVEFVSLPELEEVLVEMGRRLLVVRLERQPGQKESRYQELLTGVAAVDTNVAFQSVTELSDAEPDAVPPTEPARDLASEVDDLKRRFDVLLDRLGEQIG